MQTEHAQQAGGRPRPWNKGRLVGPKPPFKLKEIWAIRIRLQLTARIRDLALFNLAIDSKLRGCDLVSLRVADVTVPTRNLVLIDTVDFSRSRALAFAA